MCRALASSHWGQFEVISASKRINFEVETLVEILALRLSEPTAASSRTGDEPTIASTAGVPRFH